MFGERLGSTGLPLSIECHGGVIFSRENHNKNACQDLHPLDCPLGSKTLPGCPGRPLVPSCSLYLPFPGCLPFLGCPPFPPFPGCPWLSSAMIEGKAGELGPCRVRTWFTTLFTSLAPRTLLRYRRSWPSIMHLGIVFSRQLPCCSRGYRCC
jgi:hypothetical protein